MTDNNEKKEMEGAKPEERRKRGRRGKRKADIVRPGPLYKIADTMITIAGLALIGAVVFYLIMIFG